MGNESGNGNNFSTAEKAIKRLDTTRPTHYEGNSSFCDVTSCMYPSVDWLENVGRERLEKIQKTRVRDKDCVKNRVKRAKIVRFTLC